MSSDDGNGTVTLSFTIRGLEVSDYDTLVKNISRRVVEFRAQNHFTPLGANVSVVAEDSAFWQLVNVSPDDDVLVLAEVNHSLGTERSIIANVVSGNESVGYTDLFDLKSVSVDRYQRVVTSHSGRVYLFDVRNLWDAGTLSWSFSEPSLSNGSSLGHNESLLVFIAHNYSAGGREPVLNVTVAGGSEFVRDSFVVEPLSVVSLSTLAGAVVSSVSEFRIVNNWNESFGVSWRLDTDEENLTGNTTVGSSVLVFVEHNYTGVGVYGTGVFVNSSLYWDNRSGVVVT